MESSGTLNIYDIMNILPHSYPFLLVDRVLLRQRPNDLENGDWRGAKLVALKNVTINEPYFMGHFPDHPIMPGVLVVEAMAQACILLIERSDLGKRENFVLSAIDRVKFRKPIVPGDCLHLHVELKKKRQPVYLFDICTFVNNIKKAEASIKVHMI